MVKALKAHLQPDEVEVEVEEEQQEEETWYDQVRDLDDGYEILQDLLGEEKEESKDESKDEAKEEKEEEVKEESQAVVPSPEYDGMSRSVKRKKRKKRSHSQRRSRSRRRRRRRSSSDKFDDDAVYAMGRVMVAMLKGKKLR